MTNPELLQGGETHSVPEITDEGACGLVIEQTIGGHRLDSDSNASMLITTARCAVRGCVAVCEAGRWLKVADEAFELGDIVRDPEGNPIISIYDRDRLIGAEDLSKSVTILQAFVRSACSGATNDAR